MIPGISKSRFTDYMDCPKRGYMSCHRNRFKALADPFDWMTMHLMGEGNRFGQRARECFPGGRLIEHVFDLDRARAETAAAMQDETVTDIFEGAFATEGLLCRVDVLRKVGNGEVDLIEVKATSGVKPYHLPDVGFQLAVLEGSGLAVRSVSLMHFNPEYVQPGEDEYALCSLFASDDVTEEARQWVAENLSQCLESMRVDLAQAEPPCVALKNACKECVYYRQVCSVGASLHPLYELGSGSGALQGALEAAGIMDLRDIPEDFPGLADRYPLVVEAARTGGMAFECGAIPSLVEEMVFPLWFMDFETYMPGLPIFAGMRPWQQIPFQWSLHVLEEDGSLRHEEFLADGCGDPRRDFAESLMAAVGEVGSVVVYNKSMESGRLQELARDFPDLAEGLSAIDVRIVDLLPIVRASCYHLGFHGSRSLKAITPVLAPDLSYEALGLKGGLQAMEAYERITAPETGDAEREQLRTDLLAYCGLDTLAMVAVLKRLLTEGFQ
jgi:hypothetical protein